MTARELIGLCLDTVAAERQVDSMHLSHPLVVESKCSGRPLLLCEPLRKRPITAVMTESVNVFVILAYHNPVLDGYDLHFQILCRLSYN